MSDNAELKQRLRQYHYKRAIAHFEFRWETCLLPKCRAKQRCTGGPRGTFRKKGMPVCVAAAESDP